MSEPIEVDDPIEMTVASYNQMPAAWRKTIAGQRFVLIGCAVWRLVKFTK